MGKKFGIWGFHCQRSNAIHLKDKEYRQLDNPISRYTKGSSSVWRDIVAWLAFLVDTPDLEKQTCHIMVAAAGGGLGILAARLVPCLKTQTLCKLYRFKTLSAEKVLVVPRHGCPKLAAWPLSVKL